jgi:transketolase
LAELAAQLRVDSIRSSTSAGSGHPTSSMSAADLLAVLVAGHLRVDWADPRSPANDHLIFSKGHASPLLYSVFKAVGVVSADELLGGYRRFGQRLQGHPTPVLPWVDVATGSLGQGLADGVGIALAGKYLERQSYATGLNVRGYRPFASTFAAFLTRAHDFIRMGAISGVDLRLVGSHAGVEIGADGPSQMALEDLAMLRAIHGSTVLYPSDATSTAALGRSDGLQARHQLPAHHPRRLSRPVPARGGVPDRRLQGAALQRP